MELLDILWPHSTLLLHAKKLCALELISLKHLIVFDSVYEFIYWDISRWEGNYTLCFLSWRNRFGGVA